MVGPGRSSVIVVDIDDRLTLANAEGIDLDMRLAGIGSRGVALLVDLLAQMAVMFLVGLVAGAFDALGVAFFAIASFLVFVGYPILSEALASGRTLGKGVMGIAVIRVDGGPITFLAAVIRNVVRFVDALPGTYFVGIASALLTKRAQRVGDLAAGTIVIHRRPVAGPGGPGLGDAGGQFGSLPPDATGWDVSAVTAEEVAAVRSFLARRASLDPGHRSNLAQTLAFQLLPKVAGVPLEGGPEAFLQRVVTAKLAR